jgi:hypothetical protein
MGVMFALEGMAGFYSAVGKSEYTARLIGWSDAFRLKVNDPRARIEQMDIDRLIASCLASMGESSFADAYEEGRNMTLQSALAFTFEEG